MSNINVTVPPGIETPVYFSAYFTVQDGIGWAEASFSNPNIDAGGTQYSGEMAVHGGGLEFDFRTNGFFIKTTNLNQQLKLEFTEMDITGADKKITVEVWTSAYDDII